MKEIYIMKNDFSFRDKIQSRVRSEMQIIHENTLRDPDIF